MPFTEDIVFKYFDSEFELKQYVESVTYGEGFQVTETGTIGTPVFCFCLFFFFAFFFVHLMTALQHFANTITTEHTQSTHANKANKK